MQEDDSITAQVAEGLSTLDGKAERVPGCTIGGIGEAVRKHPGEVVGLHTAGGGGEGVAVAWVRDDGLDGSVHEGGGLPHGGRLCGAVLPEEGVRGQRQRLGRMWSMPQKPILMEVERRFAVTGKQGCLSLLPSDDFRQRLTHGAWYYATKDGGGVMAVPWGFFARLDKFGQLGIKFGNE